MRVLRTFFVSLLLLSSGLQAHSSSPDAAVKLMPDPEISILNISDHLYEGDFDAAEQELRQLIKVHPDFSLAQLMYAELLSSKAGLQPGFSDWLDPRSTDLASLVDEIRRRRAHQHNPAEFVAGTTPDFLLQVSPSQKHVIVVDSMLSRAHLFKNENDQLTLVGDYYITVGKNGVLKQVEGDGRTPTGVYFITSRLDPLGLDDLYGDGALPLNYPNEWDQRLGRSGFGIWLHGVPSSTYNRAPFATQGCIAFPNEDIALLYSTPEIKNTPVVITQQIHWVNRAENETLRQTVNQAIDRWRADWNIGAMDKIESSYAEDFRHQKLDRNTWLKQQRKAPANVAAGGFRVSDLSLFKYPGNSSLVVASFDRIYQTDVSSRSERLRQYWRMDVTGQWQIVYEGNAGYQPVHFKGIPDAVRPVLAGD